MRVDDWGVAPISGFQLRPSFITEGYPCLDVIMFPLETQLFGDGKTQTLTKALAFWVPGPWVKFYSCPQTDSQNTSHFLAGRTRCFCTYKKGLHMLLFMENKHNPRKKHDQ